MGGPNPMAMMQMAMAAMSGGGGPMGPPQMMEKEENAIKIMGELVRDSEVVEAYDDAIGNGKRRIIDFINKECENLRTLYVGSIPVEAREGEVRDYFESFGPMDTMDFVKKKGSRIYAYLLFRSSETIDKIQAARPHTMKGFQLNTRRVLLQKDKKIGYTKTNTICIGPPMTFSYKTGTGGLTYDFTEEQIRDYFNQFGHVIDVQRDDRDYSIACLTFEDTDAADKVALIRGFMMNGRALEAEKVFSDSDFMDEENNPDLNVHGDPEAKVMRKIFVYNIPTNATLDEVKFFFEKFGEIEEAELPKSRSTGKMYAVIVFKKSEAADKVMDDRPHRMEIGKQCRQLQPKRVVPKGEDRDLEHTINVKFFARKEIEGLKESTIENYFEDFGRVRRVILWSRPRNRAGLVIFEDEDVVQKISLLYLHKINNVEVEVTKALDSDTYRERKQQERNIKMMQEEMNRRREMMEKMQMMQMEMRQKFINGMNNLANGGRSGLEGIGGEAGMSAPIPALNPRSSVGGARGGDQWNNVASFIMLPDVPAELQDSLKLRNFFSRFGAVRTMEVRESKGYLKFREEYMTKYCLKKSIHSIEGHDLQVEKGTFEFYNDWFNIRPDPITDQKDGSADKEKENSEEKESGEKEKGEKNKNPLFD